MTVHHACPCPVRLCCCKPDVRCSCRGSTDCATTRSESAGAWLGAPGAPASLPLRPLSSALPPINTDLPRRRRAIPSHPPRPSSLLPLPPTYDERPPRRAPVRPLRLLWPSSDRRSDRDPSELTSPRTACPIALFQRPQRQPLHRARRSQRQGRDVARALPRRAEGTARARAVPPGVSPAARTHPAAGRPFAPSRAAGPDADVTTSLLCSLTARNARFERDNARLLARLREISDVLLGGQEGGGRAPIVVALDLVRLPHLDSPPISTLLPVSEATLRPAVRFVACQGGDGGVGDRALPLSDGAFCLPRSPGGTLDAGADLPHPLSSAPRSSSRPRRRSNRCRL